MAHPPAKPPSPPAVIPRWPLIRNPLGAYSAAIFLSFLALVVRMSLDPALGNAGRLAFFMFAATLCAFLFGQGPGIASTLVGMGLGIYFFIPPRNSFHIANFQLAMGAIGVAAQSLIVCFCAGSLHRALRLRAKNEEETRALYQAELRAHEATAEMNRTKDYFLAVLSHELRGPLSAIHYCVAERLEDAALTAALREDLALIDRNAQMQSRLIGDLLDLTRLTRGKMEIHLRPLDLHLLLAEAVRTSTAPGEANAGPVPALHRCASNTWIDGDRDRLLQVFWNLLRNAAKFTPHNGAIDVETFVPAAMRIAVRIRDTGIGLSAEDLDRVFHPFEQVARIGAEKKHGGLGLGLAVARGIIEMHGGTLIGASDGPGKGASFTVELPTINPSPDSAPPQHSHVDHPGRSGNALSCEAEHSNGSEL
jgi:signal transduction histidine kinase